MNETGVEIFCCYAHQDQELLLRLKTHLIPLQRLDFVSIWTDMDISPGANWEDEINKHLNAAKIILLLISPDFMASEYCYSTEMYKAIQKHECGNAYVIPIILRAVYWHEAPFSKIQVLPKNAQPIMSANWHSLDEAFFSVIEGIRKVIEKLSEKTNLIVATHNQFDKPSLQAPFVIQDNTFDTPKTKEQWMDEGKIHYQAERYKEALAAYEEVIRLDPNHAHAYVGKGDSLLFLIRDNEALASYEQAIQLDLNDVYAYCGKGRAFRGLERYKDALAAYEEAIQLDPYFIDAYLEKGHALADLKRYKDALDAYEQAIQYAPGSAKAYSFKGFILDKLGRSEEALAAYEQAIQLDPNDEFLWNFKSAALGHLGRYEEAARSLEVQRKLFSDR